MATPPIYASSDDARNDRGGRPLRMKPVKQAKFLITVGADEEGRIKSESKEKSKAHIGTGGGRTGE